jgi:hypothetical protein
MGFFLDFRQRLVATMDRIFGDAENRNLFLINDGPDMLLFEGLGNISLLRTINDLNLVDHLKAFKRRKV